VCHIHKNLLGKQGPNWVGLKYMGLDMINAFMTN